LIGIRVPAKLINALPREPKVAEASYGLFVMGICYLLTTGSLIVNPALKRMSHEERQED
jgi:hypothetical protein